MTDRQDFEAWLLEVHGLTAEWQPERNCYKEYPAHLAFQAWGASQSTRVAKPRRIYECIGKGGEYEVVAVAQGAGTLKGFNYYVYKNADGVHFMREPEDFLSRMRVKP